MNLQNTLIYYYTKSTNEITAFETYNQKSCNGNKIAVCSRAMLLKALQGARSLLSYKSRAASSL